MNQGKRRTHRPHDSKLDGLDMARELNHGELTSTSKQVRDGMNAFYIKRGLIPPSAFRGAGRKSKG